MSPLRRLRLTEAQLTDVICDAARLYGWRVSHFRPAQTARGWRTPVQGDPGFPDLCLARDGVVVFAELKVGRGRLRPAQELWRDALGEQWRLWTDRDLDEVMQFLRTRHPSAGPDPSARSHDE